MGRISATLSSIGKKQISVTTQMFSKGDSLFSRSQPHVENLGQVFKLQLLENKGTPD